MRNGYGIDPDKTISPRSISFFIGGKLPIPREALRAQPRAGVPHPDAHALRLHTHGADVTGDRPSASCVRTKVAPAVCTDVSATPLPFVQNGIYAGGWR